MSSFEPPKRLQGCPGKIRIFRVMPCHGYLRPASRSPFFLGIFAVSCCGAMLSAAPLTFEKDIRPIFKTSCFQCHGEEKEIKGDLDVRLKHLLVKGGETGPAIVPGKPDESLLIQQLK